MKRLIFITALLVVSFTSDAQVVIRTNKDKNVKTVSSTVIKKEVIYKERKLYDAKVGFQQFVELSPKMDFWEDYGHTGINYIGGWRFNNWIYAGVGTGLEFAHNFAKGAKDFIGSDIVTYKNWDDDYISSDDIDADNYGCFNRVSIPLYLHLRAYYMRTKWAPYSSVSFGGRLAPKDSGVYFDFSTGVDWRINDDYHAYFSLGFWLSKFRENSGGNYELYTNDRYSSDEDCGTRACPYYNSDERHYHNKFYNLFCGKDVFGGLSFRLGISF